MYKQFIITTFTLGFSFSLNAADICKTSPTDPYVINYCQNTQLFTQNGRLHKAFTEIKAAAPKENIKDLNVGHVEWLKKRMADCSIKDEKWGDVFVAKCALELTAARADQFEAKATECKAGECDVASLIAK